MIDNQSLIEKGHKFMMKESYYNENFVILPKYAYRALSKWYPCNLELERKVNVSSTKKKEESNQASTDKHDDEISQFFKKTVKGKIYELEISPKVIYFTL